MKKIILLGFICFITLAFCIQEKKKETQFTIAFVENVYIDKFYEVENGTDKPDSIEGEGNKIERFIGIFPKKNDTIIIYKLHKDLSEQSEKFSFWSKKINNQSIIFIVQWETI